MHWQEEGIIINQRLWQDNKYIVCLFTPSYGRHSGLYTKSKKMAGLFTGSLVNAIWQARLSDHLGLYKLELTQNISANLLGKSVPTILANCFCQLLSICLPERHPYNDFYFFSINFLKSLQQYQCQEQIIKSYIFWELEFLKIMGFALTLDKCAVTNVTAELTHVSPKTGNAVCCQVAKPYEDKLLPLPAFITSDIDYHKSSPATKDDLRLGLELTGYFIHHHLSPLPPARKILLDFL